VVTELLPLVVHAGSPAERDAAADALIRIGQRSSELSVITQPLAAAVTGQSDEVRAALLRVLGSLGGPSALDALQAALASKEEALRRAALQAFDEWPDAGPTPRLIDFAAQTAAQKDHVLALRAAAHMLERDSQLAAMDKVDLCAAALDAARRPEEMRLFLARLGSTPDPHSVLVLAPFLDEAPVAQEAASALVQLADGCIPDELPTAERALRLIAQRELPAPIAAERERVAQRFDEFAGYVTDWLVSGPYAQAGKAGHEIFDVAFPPEQPDASNDDWRPQPVHDDPRHAWLIDLLGSVGGDNRAAYLRTRILCEAECDARLELGSDDGVKVWLNEEVVHSNNALRGVSRGADVVPIHLRAGWNTLMLKVTNNGGGWGVCVRLRDPAGKPLPNVRVDADGAS
jgi:hypothetical protein